jgi:hypothetical protein
VSVDSFAKSQDPPLQSPPLRELPGKNVMPSQGAGNKRGHIYILLYKHSNNNNNNNNINKHTLINSVYNIYITFTYVYLNGTIELWNHLMISAWWNPSFDMIAPHLQGQQKALPCLSQLLAM